MPTSNRQLGAKIRRLRENKGYSVHELTFEVDTKLPRSLRVTDETIRKYEVGGGPKVADPIIVGAIAEALDVSIDDLDPEIAEDQARIATLLSRCADRVERSRNLSHGSHRSTSLHRAVQTPVFDSIITLAAG